MLRRRLRVKRGRATGWPAICLREAPPMQPAEARAFPSDAPQSELILEVQGLCKEFPLPRGLGGALRRMPRQAVHAVDGVSFDLRRGEILALVGESGWGESAPP